MSEQTPDRAGHVTDGPADPEHDATAAYGLDRSYVAGLTRRIVSTTGETVAVSSPIGGTPQELQAFIASEIKTWVTLVRQANIRLE